VSTVFDDLLLAGEDEALPIPTYSHIRIAGTRSPGRIDGSHHEGADCVVRRHFDRPRANQTGE